MPAASDNIFPKLLLAEGAAPATPASGTVKVFAKADGLLYSKDDLGVETPLSFVSDAELAAIAALVSAADRLPYFTGGGTAALAVFTAAARTLLAAVDAAAQRTAMGLGTGSLLVTDTDVALAANSDANAATQKAVKTYVDAAVTGLLDFKGATDCSTTPNYPAAAKGDSYVVSVAGKIGGASGTVVEVGDVYVASADNAGGTQAVVGASWFLLEHNLQGAVLTGGALGTPSSGSLNNCTSLPVATGVSGLGAGMASALALAPGAASGLASLSAGSAVVQDPANAQETPAAGKIAKFTATGGHLRGAVSLLIWGRSGVGASQTALALNFGVTASIVVPAGWKCDIFGATLYSSSTIAAGGLCTGLVYVDGADVSASFGALQIGAGTDQRDESEPTAPPYTIDATVGSKLLGFRVTTNASTGASITYAGGLLVCFYKP